MLANEQLHHQGEEKKKVFINQCRIGAERRLYRAVDSKNTLDWMLSVHRI